MPYVERAYADVIKRLPLDFWRILHAEYGIVVYPSALMQDVDIHGVGVDATFTDAYCGHIGMRGLSFEPDIG